MKTNPEIVIITLNWNRGPDSIQCLESIFRSTYKNFRVILLDNGSTDGSVERFVRWGNEKFSKTSSPIRQNSAFRTVELDHLVRATKNSTQGKENLAKKDWKMTLVQCPSNLGFSKGNNLGIKYAFEHTNTELIMFLNNDTVIRPDCLELLVGEAINHRRVGAFQPKMLSLADPSLIDAVGISPGSLYFGAYQVGYRLQNSRFYGQNQEIFGVCGGASLYRKSTLQDIGLFDETYFAYYEDVDLAIRARLANWKARLVSDAIVYHSHSATLGSDAPLKIFLLERNKYLYVLKCFPVSLVLKFLLTRPLVIAKTILRLLVNNQIPQAVSCLLGNFSGIYRGATILTKRKSIRALQKIPDEHILEWFLPKL